MILFIYAKIRKNVIHGSVKVVHHDSEKTQIQSVMVVDQYRDITAIFGFFGGQGQLPIKPEQITKSFEKEWSF